MYDIQAELDKYYRAKEMFGMDDHRDFDDCPPGTEPGYPKEAAILGKEAVVLGEATKDYEKLYDHPELRENRFRGLCDQFARFLAEKNRRYGNSVLEPLNIFSKHACPAMSRDLAAYNGMLYRLDDKLARIKNADQLRKNDLADIVGYIIPLMINLGYTDLEDLID